MAKKSGSSLKFALGAPGQANNHTPIHGTEHGFDSSGLSSESGSFTVTSGGFMKTKDSGHRVTTLPFSCDEDSVTDDFFLMKNGSRYNLEFDAGEGEKHVEVVIQVSHNYNARAQRRYEGTAYFDGAAT